MTTWMNIKMEKRHIKEWIK